MDTCFSQTEGSISPSLPHIFSTIKTEPNECWNPQSASPSNGIAENYSTYTALEAVHPESPYTSYFPMGNSLAYGGFQTLHPSYSLNCEDSDAPLLHTLYRNPPDHYSQRDEGLGSSPSSFNSSSPPTIVNEQMPPTSPAAIHQYYGRPNERNSPGDSSFHEEIPLHQVVERTECVNCGDHGTDTWWLNQSGHYLCVRCRLPSTPEDDNERNEKKRKRPTHVNKKENQLCTNCATQNTSLWRRNMKGEVVCNACGLYEKLHKCARPISMKKDTIQTRKRKPRGSGSKKRVSNGSVIKTEHLDTPVTAPYTLPTYNTLHVRSTESDLQPLPNTVILPSINSSAPFYYRPDTGNGYHIPSGVITFPLEPPRISTSPSTNC